MDELKEISNEERKLIYNISPHYVNSSFFSTIRPNLIRMSFAETYADLELKIRTAIIMTIEDAQNMHKALTAILEKAKPNEVLQDVPVSRDETGSEVR